MGVVTLLTDDDLAQIEHRCRRAGSANCWTGTSGTLAADVLRLLRERARLLATIATLRSREINSREQRRRHT